MSMRNARGGAKKATNRRSRSSGHQAAEDAEHLDNLRGAQGLQQQQGAVVGGGAAGGVNIGGGGVELGGVGGGPIVAPNIGAGAGLANPAIAPAHADAAALMMANPAFAAVIANAVQQAIQAALGPLAGAAINLAGAGPGANQAAGVPLVPPGVVLPADGAVVPAVGANVPNAGAVLPAVGAYVPNAGAVLPAAGANVPAVGAVMPAGPIPALMPLIQKGGYNAHTKMFEIFPYVGDQPMQGMVTEAVKSTRKESRMTGRTADAGILPTSIFDSNQPIEIVSKVCRVLTTYVQGRRFDAASTLLYIRELWHEVATRDALFNDTLAQATTLDELLLYLSSKFAFSDAIQRYDERVSNIRMRDTDTFSGFVSFVAPFVEAQSQVIPIWKWLRTKLRPLVALAWRERYQNAYDLQLPQFLLAHIPDEQLTVQQKASISFASLNAWMLKDPQRSACSNNGHGSASKKLKANADVYDKSDRNNGSGSSATGSRRDDKDPKKSLKDKAGSKGAKRGSDSGAKSALTCFYCGRQGHKGDDCRDTDAIKRNAKANFRLAKENQNNNQNNKNKNINHNKNNNNKNNNNSNNNVSNDDLKKLVDIGKKFRNNNLATQSSPQEESDVSFDGNFFAHQSRKPGDSAHR